MCQTISWLGAVSPAHNPHEIDKEKCPIYCISRMSVCNNCDLQNKGLVPPLSERLNRKMQAFLKFTLPSFYSQHGAGYDYCSAQINSHKQTHSRTQSLKHAQFGQKSSYNKHIIAN